MAGLKLPLLPDRAPVKISISLTPQLHQALLDYAALYAKTYGRDEPLAELIPAVLGAFLAADKVFAKWSKQEGSVGG